MAPDTDYIGMTKRGANKYQPSLLKSKLYFDVRKVHFLLTRFVQFQDISMNSNFDLNMKRLKI